MHEIARHGIHISEVLEVSTQTLEALQDYEAATRQTLIPALEEEYCQQMNEYMKFQLQTLKSLKLRSESNNKRLQNEITLVRCLSLLVTEQILTDGRHSTQLLTPTTQ